MKRLSVCIALLLLTGCGFSASTQPLSGENPDGSSCTEETAYQPVFPTQDSGIKQCYQKCRDRNESHVSCKNTCDKTPPLAFQPEACFGECILVGCENILSCGQKCFQESHKYAPRVVCVDDCIAGGLDAGVCENKCYQIDPTSFIGTGMTCVQRCLGDAGKKEPCERACAKFNP